MTTLILAIGLVLSVEGLALALAPSRLEDLLARFAAIDPNTRRMIGLATLAIGVLLVWLARHLAS
jgi:uncharacterized protein YjeT (DUF2065 family)